LKTSEIPQKMFAHAPNYSRPGQRSMIMAQKTKSAYNNESK
jgi:hypothetical protein